jgi:hypothetical protein
MRTKRTKRKKMKRRYPEMGGTGDHAARGDTTAALPATYP